MSSKGGSVKVLPEDMDEAARVSVGIDKDDLSTNVELKKKTKQEPLC